MNIVAVAAFFLPIGTGLLLIPPCVASRQPVWVDWLMRLPLAVAVGIGLHSTGFFLSLLLFDGSFLGIVLLDTVVLILAGVCRVFGRSRPIFVEDRATYSSRLEIALVGVCLFLGLVSLLTFVIASIEEPHGGWDAWAIWNLRARFLAEAGDRWPAALSSTMQHTDYPLLLPGAIARVWSYGLTVSVLVPIATALLFSLSLIALTCGALATLRSNIQALLAGILLLAIVLNEAAYQYADIQVGFYLLVSLVLLAWQDRTGSGGTYWIVLAGLSAALAAWTKNEGLLFLFAIVAGRVFARKLDRFWYFFVGAAPVLTLLAYFKLTLAPPNDLLPDLEWARLLDPERYRELAGAVWKESSGALHLIAAALLPPFVYRLLLGPSARRDVSTGTWLLTLLTSIAGFLILYLVSTRELDWLVANSMDRLSLQMYPVTVLLVLLSAASPQERLPQEPAERLAVQGTVPLPPLPSVPG